MLLEVDSLIRLLVLLILLRLLRLLEVLIYLGLLTTIEEYIALLLFLTRLILSNLIYSSNLILAF